MNSSATSVSKVPEIPNPLARADALEAKITQLCAHINAASYRLFQLVAALDDEAPWGARGLASCAHWLNWRCGIGLNAAREKVRVAHALKPLARISAAFASGELNFSKVRALTRIADTGNEVELLDLARHATAAQVEKLVRTYRRVGRLEEREQSESVCPTCISVRCAAFDHCPPGRYSRETETRNRRHACLPHTCPFNY